MAPEADGSILYYAFLQVDTGIVELDVLVNGILERAVHNAGLVGAAAIHIGVGFFNNAIAQGG